MKGSRVKTRLSNARLDQFCISGSLELGTEQCLHSLAGWSPFLSLLMGFPSTLQGYPQGAIRTFIRTQRTIKSSQEPGASGVIQS